MSYYLFYSFFLVSIFIFFFIDKKKFNKFFFIYLNIFLLIIFYIYKSYFILPYLLIFNIILFKAASLKSKLTKPLNLIASSVFFAVILFFSYFNFESKNLYTQNYNKSYFLIIISSAIIIFVFILKKFISEHKK